MRKMGTYMTTIISDGSISDATVYGMDFTLVSDGTHIHEGTGTFLVRSSVVPIPAAVWLFGSALAAMGWVRRKQIS